MTIRGRTRLRADQHVAADRRRSGIAALSAIATSTTSDAVSTGTAADLALTDGSQAAFIVGAAVAFVGVLVALFVVDRRDLVQENAEELQPAFDQAASRT